MEFLGLTQLLDWLEGFLAKNVSLPDLKELIEGQKFSQSGEVTLEDIDFDRYNYYYIDISALRRDGVRFSTNCDLSGEKLSASATPFYGSADLLAAELVTDGSKVYVNSPELTGTAYYEVDTTTLGKDLRKLGADRDEVDALSFNIFQLVKNTQEITKMDSDSRKAVEGGGKNSMELYLEELEFRTGEMPVTLRVDYSISSYQNIPSVKSPVMLSTLNGDIGQQQ